jgi:acyl carrier protein
MKLMQPLTAVFRSVFENDEIILSPEMTANDVEGWDSLSHVVLILAIENRFKIKFSPKELLTLRNVGDLMKAIQSKNPKLDQS